MEKSADRKGILTPGRAPKPGSAHRRMDVFAGTWRIQGKVEASLAAPEAAISGINTYEWMQGGFFLIHQWDVRIGEEQLYGIEILGYDAPSKMYVTLFFDSLGNANTYRGSVRGNTWIFRSESERCTVVFTDAGNTVTTNWERSSDGSNWLPLCEVRATKER